MSSKLFDLDGGVILRAHKQQNNGYRYVTIIHPEIYDNDGRMVEPIKSISIAISKEQFVPLINYLEDL